MTIAIPGIFGLKITNDATNPATKVNVTAIGAVMIDASSNGVSRANLSLPIDLTTSGAGGLDVGALAMNCLLYLYVIDDGTTTAGLASLSSSSPTLPSGYTYVCRIGAWPTDTTTATLLRMQINGKRAAFLQHMSTFEGRYCITSLVGSPKNLIFVDTVLTGIPPTASWVFVHALQTNGYNFQLEVIDPLNRNPSGGNLACIWYAGGSDTSTLTLRLFGEYPMTVPQTLSLANNQVGAGLVINGWIDSTNAT